MHAGELLDAGFRYALALTHDRDEAEDLVQDAWLKLHERSRLLRGRGYFLRTIRNLFIDRHRRSRMILLDPLPPDDALPAAGGSVAAVESPEALQASEATAALIQIGDGELHDALAQLRPEEREALYLNAVEGLSASRIAGLTDRPRSTVLSLIQRGKQKMQQMLHNRHHTDEGERHESKTEI